MDRQQTQKNNKGEKKMENYESAKFQCLFSNRQFNYDGKLRKSFPFVCNGGTIFDLRTRCVPSFEWAWYCTQ